MGTHPSRLALIAIAGLFVAAGLFLLRSTALRERAARLPAQAGPDGNPATPAASTAVARGGEATGQVSDRPRSATAGQRSSPQLPKPILEEPPQAGEPGIRLMPPPEERGSLLVQVVDPDGKPVTGASVRLHRADFCGEEDVRSSGAYSEGKTDGDGLALINRLAGGAWHVVAASTGKGISWRGRQPRGQAHVATFVKPEGQSSAMVTLEVGLVLAGRVLCPGEAGCQDVFVIASSEIGCGERVYPVAIDGSFRMDGLCRGPWRCYAGQGSWGDADWPGSFYRRIANSAPVRVTESREDLELKLPVPSSLSGRLLGIDADAIRGLAVNLETQHRYGLRFKDGEFLALGVDPGPYLIVAYDAQGWAILDGVRVEEGSAVTDLELTVEPAARVCLPASAGDGCVSISLDGVRLPAERAWEGGKTTYSVPARHLDVEVRLDGERYAWTVDALAGQTLTLGF